jgi:hypothetical protein
MPACESCLDRHGHPSAVGQLQALALIGVRELCGVLAVEHYRCIACGTSFSRVLVGETKDRIWQSLDCHRAEHR